MATSQDHAPDRTRRALLLGALSAPFVGWPAPGHAASAHPLASLPLPTLGGGRLDPALLRGKVVLFVNVASYCGYTPQYTDLQRLYEAYKAKGFLVVGAPCNQFGNQEPHDASAIQRFCSSRYGVQFPLLAKQDVNGPGRSPLYRYLVDSPQGGGADIAWNFEKFLVGRDGTVLARFPSELVPTDPKVTVAIEIALAATA